VYPVPDVAFGTTPMVAKIAAGAYHTCMARSAGLGVFCLGNNNHGQSGPSPGSIVSSTEMAVDVAAGGYHTCSVQPILFATPTTTTPLGGVIQCWGENHDGQVNGIAGPDVKTPVVVSGP
jgi:hypothetical protein